MVIACGYCGEWFEEDRGQVACERCPLGTHCGLARCPRCGFENTKVPPWIARLRSWIRGGGVETS